MLRRAPKDCSRHLMNTYGGAPTVGSVPAGPREARRRQIARVVAGSSRSPQVDADAHGNTLETSFYI